MHAREVEIKGNDTVETNTTTTVRRDTGLSEDIDAVRSCQHVIDRVQQTGNTYYSLRPGLLGSTPFLRIRASSSSGSLIR